VTTARADPRKPTHVACVGDSITAGAGASATAKNYVSQLQGLLGGSVQVKNFGHSGATMLSEGYGDLPYNKQPEYTAATDFVTNAGAAALVSVIVILGTNDSKPFNWEPANKPKNDQQFLIDYRALVKHFTDLPTKPVVYVGLPLATGTNPCCSIRGDVIHDQELPLLKQLAGELHLPIIDFNTGTTGHLDYFGDGVHPTDGGYAVMAMLAQQGLARVPTVSISSPSAGAVVTGGMVPLTADASGGSVLISSVEFFEGTTSLGKATAMPFTVSWPAAMGMHEVTAKAIDSTLAFASSASVKLEVAGGGAAAAGGSAGAAGAGGGSAGTGATVGVGGAATNAAGAASAGIGGAPASGAGGGVAAAGSATLNPTGSPAAGGGCSCSLPREASSGRERWLLLSALALVLRRRRRQHAA
jgi:acyl-CoA thioesterase-1